MNLGVVRPRIVFGVVFERTGRLVVDRKRDGGRGRTASIVRPNRVGCRRCLQDRWNAPYGSVARSEVEACWKGRIDGPRGDGT